MEFGDLFSFDKKIAPAIIKPLYWIGLVLMVVSGLFYFFYGFGSLFSSFGYGLWMMITSIIFVIIGVPVMRVAAETCLAIFEIHDKVTGSSSPSQM
jgi:hypothetical protein